MDRRSFISKSTVSAFGITMTRNKWSENLIPHGWINNDLIKSIDLLGNKLSAVRSSHPSLHFNAARLKELRKLTHGTHERYANLLYQWIENKKAWSPPFITGVDGEEVQLEECAAFLTNASLAYCLSRKKEYLTLSRRWAMAMCNIPEEAVRNYGMGIYVAGLARAYDWLYHELKTEERVIIRDTITDIIRRMYEGTLPGASVPMWWAKAYMHHDHWIAAGGFGEACLALLGEVNDSARYAAFAKTNFDIIFSWLGDDGAWHEGAADWCYTMAPLLWFYGAWESKVGEDLHQNKWIENTALYRLYHWLPDDTYIYLDDSFRSGRYSTSGGASCHLLRRLASLFRNGYAQWLADRDEVFDLKPSPKGVYQAPYERLSFTGEPKEYPNPLSQCLSWNILWYDPSVKPLSPDKLSPSMHFKNQGIAIMRTGWDRNETVISFTCGPLSGHLCAERIRKGEKIVSNFYSHAHLDFNSFTLFANGQYFIIPAGYARRTGSFQNVISVNGADFIADPASEIRLTAFICKNEFSYSVGDGTKIFMKDLGVERYLRHVLLYQNQWLFIFDDLVLNTTTSRSRGYNRFTWTVHSDPNTHSPYLSDNQVDWRSKCTDHPPLFMHVLEPQDFAWEKGLLKSSRGKTMMEAVRIIRSEWYSNKMQVLTAWSWDEKADKPRIFKNQYFTAALFGKQKAIGFATEPGFNRDLIPAELKEYEFLLFGSDPNLPDSYSLFRDGKIKIN